MDNTLSGMLEFAERTGATVRMVPRDSNNKALGLVFVVPGTSAQKYIKLLDALDALIDDDEDDDLG